MTQARLPFIIMDGRRCSGPTRRPRQAGAGQCLHFDRSRLRSAGTLRVFWDLMFASAMSWLFSMLALPDVGLSTAFIVSFLSATLLPLGSEPAVFAVVKANVDLFWPAILLATAGNTLGGMVDYWLGYGAHELFAHERRSRWFGWLERFGPKTLLLAWLPGIGDPLCVLAGWLQLPFWPRVAYMAIGKFLRYLVITALLLNVPDGFWREMLSWSG